VIFKRLVALDYYYSATAELVGF